mmetsp:Transcript_11050/g.24222  ORF Transcript_11050/g.24222 Transcript_11050/m.24222 type:complete len:246 (-) Transcript_11050:2356-3093(-)
MAEGPLSASLFSLFFASVPPFPLPLPTCGLMKSASLKCREEALSSSDIRDVLPLPVPSFPPFPELSPFLPPFGLGGTAAGGICVGSGEAFTLGLAIETSLRALEFPLTSTHSCRSCASNMGLLLFSGWRKGEMAADLGDDLEDIAGEAYFDGTAAICGETLETLDARRLRRASSFSASASSCTCSSSSSANDKPNFSAMRPSPAAEPGREVAKRDKAWEAIEDHWPLSQSLLISFNILSSSMSSI